MGIGGQVTRSGWWLGLSSASADSSIGGDAVPDQGGRKPTPTTHQSHEQPPPADSLLLAVADSGDCNN